MSFDYFINESFGLIRLAPTTLFNFNYPGNISRNISDTNSSKSIHIFYTRKLIAKQAIKSAKDRITELASPDGGSVVSGGCVGALVGGTVGVELCDGGLNHSMTCSKLSLCHCILSR